MASIVEKLTNAVYYRDKIKKSLKVKGSDITDITPLKDYYAKVDSLSLSTEGVETFSVLQVRIEVTTGDTAKYSPYILTNPLGKVKIINKGLADFFLYPGKYKIESNVENYKPLSIEFNITDDQVLSGNPIIKTYSLERLKEV